MMTSQDIYDAIMEPVLEQIKYAKTTYDKLYTWQPVWTMLQWDGEVWRAANASQPAMWRWYGNPNDKTVSQFSPNTGDMWMEVK